MYELYKALQLPVYSIKIVCQMAPHLVDKLYGS